LQRQCCEYALCLHEQSSCGSIKQSIFQREQPPTL
jgi:hypothetical protein